MLCATSSLSQAVFGQVPVTPPRLLLRFAPGVAVCCSRAERGGRSARGHFHTQDRRCLLMAPAGSCTKRHPRAAPSPPSPPARDPSPGAQEGKGSEGKGRAGGSDNCIRFLCPSLLWRDHRSDRKAAVSPESSSDFQLETFC